MRILDKYYRESDNVLLMLTPKEANELISSLQILLERQDGHSHIYDVDYQREITVAVYTPENIHTFSDQVRRLIEKDQGYKRAS